MKVNLLHQKRSQPDISMLFNLFITQGGKIRLFHRNAHHLTKINSWGSLFILFYYCCPENRENVRKKKKKGNFQQPIQVNLVLILPQILCPENKLNQTDRILIQTQTSVRTSQDILNYYGKQNVKLSPTQTARRSPEPSLWKAFHIPKPLWFEVYPKK